MKHMRGFLIILSISFIGELLNELIPLPVPASIYGLVLMLAALCTKLVKLENVKIAGDFLLEIMPPMFIPAAVGLVTAWADLKSILVPVLVITVVTNVLVMAVTGRVSQAVIRFRKGGRQHE